MVLCMTNIQNVQHSCYTNSKVIMHSVDFVLKINVST
jgi:hypothetical protein